MYPNATLISLYADARRAEVDARHLTLAARAEHAAGQSRSFRLPRLVSIHKHFVLSRA